MRRRVWWYGLAILLCAGRVWGQTPFSHQGYDTMHPPDSAIPNEQVDPASGTLTVSATDLVLPGNAGFNVAIQRVYNSSVYPNYDSGSTAYEEDSWAGIGWKLHFGRILHADSTTPGQIQVEMGDGSRHPLYHSLAVPGSWTTSDFWIYDSATHKLKLPNGLVYTFDRQVFINSTLGNVRYVTEIRDPFQNVVTFSYFSSPGPIDGVQQIHQVLSATQSRDVTFTYDATSKTIATMTYLTHTWTYSHDAIANPAGYSVLRTVQPPAGHSTIYGYGANGDLTGEMTSIGAPLGGQITYAYDDAYRKAGAYQVKTRVVTQRTTYGHGWT